MQQYGVIAIFFIVGTLFPIIAILLSRFLGPKKKPCKIKEDTYECGLTTEGPSWIQFKMSYFLYALVFLVFDVETIFLYPWAVKFQSLGLFALIEMLIFIAILVVGFWYAWKEGALEWR